MEVDRWGVPLRMFGPAGEEFYGLVGRIALVSALLEDRLLVLLSQLAIGSTATEEVHEYLDRFGGAPGTQLISECRRYLDRFWPDRRAEADAFLSDAKVALLKRHEIVHSLWSFGTRTEVRGWRHVLPRKRQAPNQPVEWTSLTTEELPELLTVLVELVDRSQRRIEGWVRLQ